jgi:hypothetical protein
MAAYPIVGEAVRPDDLSHRFGVVEIVTIPGASVVAWGVARSRGEADVAAHLVEILIHAPSRCETHQSRTAVRCHPRSISQNADLPVWFGIGVEGPFVRRVDRKPLDHPLDILIQNQIRKLCRKTASFGSRYARGKFEGSFAIRYDHIPLVIRIVLIESNDDHIGSLIFDPRHLLR